MKQSNTRLSAALVMVAMTYAPLVTASPVMASGEAARAPAQAEEAGEQRPASTRRGARLAKSDRDLRKGVPI